LKRRTVLKRWGNLAQLRQIRLDCDNLQYYCANAVMWPGIQTYNLVLYLKQLSYSRVMTK
jgi:hypothetical protein